MTVFEIVATIVLSIIGLCLIWQWGIIVLMCDRISRHYEEEKKPAPKNEADEEK